MDTCRSSCNPAACIKTRNNTAVKFGLRGLRLRQPQAGRASSRLCVEPGCRNFRALLWDQDEGSLRGQAYNSTIRSLMKRYRYRKGKLQTAPRQCIVPPDTLSAPPLGKTPDPPPQKCPPPPSCNCPNPPPQKAPQKCPPPPSCPELPFAAEAPPPHTLGSRELETISRIHVAARGYQTHLIYLLGLVLAFAAGLTVSAARGWMTQSRGAGHREQQRLARKELAPSQ